MLTGGDRLVIDGFGEVGRQTGIGEAAFDAPALVEPISQGKAETDRLAVVGCLVGLLGTILLRLALFLWVATIRGRFCPTALFRIISNGRIDDKAI